MSSSSRRSTSSLRPGAKDATRLRIEKMEAEREERRRAMKERKEERAAEDRRNKEAGTPGDVDFVTLVRKWRESHVVASTQQSPLTSSTKRTRPHPKICICVRKRPIFDKERRKNDHDCVTCLQPQQVWVHQSKLRVDGITKFLDHFKFQFDHAFDEKVSTEEVYKHSTMPLIDFVCAGNGGRATVFAYGQTGSGKTYTMMGVQEMVADDLFHSLASGHAGCSFDNTAISVAFFEIYGGFVQDLLSHRKRLKVLEDGKGEIVVNGLEEFEATDAAQFLNLVAEGNESRTTHETEANDTSSRSHAICQILLRDRKSNRLRGKLSLVDLAGSERGTDTKAHNQQRRAESAEINTSLLSLKECIRALDNKSSHVPYRASKLTLILKDCFTSKQARTTMIATVSPGSSSADHTLNTLRYADRIKEKKVGGEPSKQPSSASKQCAKDLTPPRRSSSLISEPKNLTSPPRRSTSLVGDARDGVERKSTSVRPAKLSLATRDDDEGNLRKIVNELLEQEESLLNTHMSNIQENAEMLIEEGKLIQEVQGNNVSDEQMDRYTQRLTEILDRKTHLIERLQERMIAFRSNMKKEEELSLKVGKLRQY